jgi:hypothetical protein
MGFSSRAFSMTGKYAKLLFMGKKDKKAACFKTNRMSGVFFTLLAGFCFAVPAGCSRPQPQVPAPLPQSEPEESRFPWKALAILKTGENPLWFELSEDGPRLVSSPGEAALFPYTPWPLSRYITGMIPWDGDLVLAANRCGFYVLTPLVEGGAVLYDVSNSAQWNPYAVSSFFMYENHPAVVLYRDVFFAESSAPPSDPPFFILSRESPIPEAVSFSIQDTLPESPAGKDAAWELNNLRLSRDGFWYGRWMRIDGPKPETVYFKTADLSQPGKTVSAGEYRNSGLPEPVSAAPAFVTAFLAALADQVSFGAVQTAVELVSPSFPAARIFSADIQQGGVESTSALRGYYRETPNPFVIAVDAGGRLFGSGEGFFSFSLPLLPEGFAYTGVCLTGEVLAATWEEQEDSGIGAAGFMVMDAGAFGISRF